MSDFVRHAVHAAAHEKKNPKLAGVMLIIIGLCFTPWLIGLPIMIYGFFKLFSSLFNSPTKAS
jgi:F0F1-type ATP synthase membrane subunit c/vacuolar-type H+-ATPase subunit K